MVAKKAESAVAEQEPEQTLIEGLKAEASEVEGETSTEPVEEETESKEKEEGSEEPSEDIEDKVQRLAQSIADKSTKTITKERDTLRQQIKDLQSQVTEKMMDRGLTELFNEDVENLGEDKAKQKDADRKELVKNVNEYLKNKNSVTQVQEAIKTLIDDIGDVSEKWGLDADNPVSTIKNLGPLANKLGAIERNQQARDKLWKLLVPDDNGTMKQVNDLLKKFDKAQDQLHFDVIMQGIEQTLKGKKFEPDSGKGAGGGGIDLSKLTPIERITRGLKIEETKRR